MPFCFALAAAEGRHTAEVERLQVRLAEAEEKAKRAKAIKEHAKIERKFVKETEEKSAVSVKRLTQASARALAEEEETLRVGAVANAFLHELTLFAHAQCGKAVKDRESLLADETAHGLSMGRNIARGEDRLPLGIEVAELLTQ